MASVYHPLVLNGGLAADGEGAQLLSILDGGSPAVAIPRGSEPNPFRKGRMSMVLLLILDSTTLAGGTGIAISMRSPFPDDAGDINNRPLLTATMTVTSPVSAPRFTMAGSVVPVTPVPTVDPAFSATFNGKAIPNWNFLLNFQPADTELVNVIIGVDFGASIAS